MRKFVLNYLIPRIVQYFFVIFLGVTLTFIIPRLSPVDPVEAQINRIMMSGSEVNPDAIISMREALTEMYGLEGSDLQQYFAFWGRLLRGIWDRRWRSSPRRCRSCWGRYGVDIRPADDVDPDFVGGGQCPRRDGQLLREECTDQDHRRVEPGGASYPLLHYGAAVARGSSPITFRYFPSPAHTHPAPRLN
ncbi:MAG: hypothetical protein R2873_26180 [Caldilineaceae bacterium]